MLSLHLVFDYGICYFNCVTVLCIAISLFLFILCDELHKVKKTTGLLSSSVKRPFVALEWFQSTDRTKIMFCFNLKNRKIFLLESFRRQISPTPYLRLRFDVLWRIQKADRISVLDIKDLSDIQTLSELFFFGSVHKGIN